MGSATRQAQRLANNFLDDLDSMQRESRARDRRAMSHFDNGVESSSPRVIHSTRRYAVPVRSTRMTSVPPSPISYRSTVYTTDSSLLPPAVPRTTYTTRRYVSESPYYLTSYTSHMGKPSRTILTPHYSVAPPPVNRRYSYYYPSVVTSVPTSSLVRYGSYTDLLPEVRMERRRIDHHMDDLLNYKVPSPEYYREMRGSLRSLHDRMDEHRRLLDRYSGIDMNAAPSSVAARIESKYQQLATRMGRVPTATVRA